MPAMNRLTALIRLEAGGPEGFLHLHSNAQALRGEAISSFSVSLEAVLGFTA